MNTYVFIQYMRLKYAKVMRNFYDEFIYDDNDNNNIREDIIIIIINGDFYIGPLKL